MTKGFGGGVDGFLESGGDFERGGSYLKGWKSKGKTRVFLNRRIFAAKSWIHSIPRLVEIKDRESGDKRLVLRSERWFCHEAEALLLKRYKRDDDGDRIYPPVLCPACILLEVLARLVREEKLSWTDPLFRWDAADSGTPLDDDDEAEKEILVGGAYGAFTTKDVRESKEARAILKKAGVRQDEAFRQNLAVKMSWLFYVVDPAAEGEPALLKTFEAKSLGEQMKTAIRDEMKRNTSDPKRGDPTVNPYAFEWSYDEKKQFDDRYHVIALSNDKPSPEILEAISTEHPTDEEVAADLKPGNCWWLRDELETHLVPGVSLPWDDIFAPAKKAGLMIPPSDSKGEVDEDDDEPASEKAPKRRRLPAEVGSPPKEEKVEMVEVGPEHDVWFEKAAPDPTVKGKRVLLRAPEGTPGDDDDPPATKEEIDVVRKELKKWGAKSVALVVSCDFCEGEFPDDETECPACGTGYDETGKLTSIRCLAAPKGEAHDVPIEGPGPNHICPKCAAIHALAPETPDLVGRARWSLMKKPEPASAAAGEAPARRRRAAGAKE